MFEIKILDDISRAFNADLPADLSSMDSHLEFILPKIVQNGEDLREGNFWLGKRWKEIRDDDTFHEAILHIFMEGGEYLFSVDGNIIKGTWRQIGENTLIIEIAGKSELFDLAFLNDDFLILKKHGDQKRKGRPGHFVLCNEGTLNTLRRNLPEGAPEIDWRNVMELLFNVYRSDFGRYAAWAGFFLVVILIILVLSFG